MKQVVITLPEGSPIFTVPGPLGVLLAAAVVGFDVHEADMLAHGADPENIDAFDPVDVVAAGLAAGGHEVALPLLTHEGVDAEGVAVKVVYTPTGRRVEQYPEETAAAEERIAEIVETGEDPRVVPEEPKAEEEEVETVPAEVVDLQPESVPNFATSAEAAESPVRDNSSPENPRADGSYGYPEEEAAKSDPSPDEAEYQALCEEAKAYGIDFGGNEWSIEQLKEALAAKRQAASELSPDLAPAPKTELGPNAAAALAGELQLETLEREDLEDVARIAYGFDGSSRVEFPNKETLIEAIRAKQNSGEDTSSSVSGERDPLG